MKAQDGWTILEYEREKDYTETKAGLLVMSQRNQRAIIKGKTHMISGDPDAALPDVIRIATILDSDEYKAGLNVLFNKHDGWGFQFDEKYLYAIQTNKVIAVL